MTTGNALPRSVARFAPLEAIAAAAAIAAERVAAAAAQAGEREAARIMAGAHSPHVALTARVLPAEHSARVAVAALATAQRDALPAALEYTRSAALAALSADENTRSMTALLTARELVASIDPQTAWIRRRPISPRDPAPARLA